jgi:two-component system sensor histidine kinase KdpD
MSEPATRRKPDGQLDRLRFLYDIARLATTAGTWEELLEIVVDGTRDALHADVSSFYLLDRAGDYLTLAATNGLDRFQIGRARVPYGEGITGRVAARRTPLVIPDVRSDSRFLWVRGIDQRRFIASMLSVPLTWHDQIVGVLNVQTATPRDFTPDDVAQLGAIADILAGIVEKGRLQREAESQLEQLRAIDRARTELIALVTHELRTPLAVVRAYADLLAEEPELEGRTSRDPVRRENRSAWHEAATSQIERLDRLVDSILASVQAEDGGPVERQIVDVVGLVEDVLGQVAPLLRHHRVVVDAPARPGAIADPGRLRQVTEHLLENAVKYAPPDSQITVDVRGFEGTVRLGVNDDGPGIPEEWRERIFEPYARRDTRTARGSGIGLFAARRLAESMGGHVWCEPAMSGGARFVVSLPAAASA